MKYSTERILTTHTGSLPRPARLMELLASMDRGEEPDPERLVEELRNAVDETVRRQIATGIDVINDGEASKISYATYVAERLGGIGGEGRWPQPYGDVRNYPDWARTHGFAEVGDAASPPACVADVTYADTSELEKDIAVLRAAVDEMNAHDAFMSAASPGVIALFLENKHYASREEYVQALGAAMKTEYDAIHAAGFVLQVDCPDLAMGRHVEFPDATLDEWRRIAMQNVEVLNEATRDIPPEAMRMHLCWGNYEGPHDHDVPLSDILDIVFAARPSAICFEAANPRHEHEWSVFEDIKLPEGKVLVPGVIDSTTNYVEHPEVVARRLLNFAHAVGRENVIGGSDCGFATVATFVPIVDPTVTYAKLHALVEGARLASGELWDGKPAHTPVALRG